MIVIDDDREALTLTSSDHARQFGRALLAAADEWEQMAIYDRIGVTRSPGTALPPVPLPPG